MEPIFIKTTDKQYYFNIDNNQIYGPKKYSFGYWHEMSHYKDHTHNWYSKINITIQTINQIAAIFFTMIAMFYIVMCDFNPAHWANLMQATCFMFIPYCIFSFQEETRADLYAAYIKVVKRK
jgi:hypothetical protein